MAHLLDLVLLELVAFPPHQVQYHGKVSLRWILVPLPLLRNGPDGERTLCPPPVISPQGVSFSYRDLMQMALAGRRCYTCLLVLNSHISISEYVHACTFISDHILITSTSLRTYSCQTVVHCSLPFLSHGSRYAPQYPILNTLLLGRGSQVSHPYEPFKITTRLNLF
jgi:hypothetical protein